MAKTKNESIKLEKKKISRNQREKGTCFTCIIGRISTYYIEIYRLDFSLKTAPQKILTTIEYKFIEDFFNNDQSLIKFNDDEVFQVDSNQKTNKQVNEIIIKHIIAEEDKVEIFHS